MDFLAFLRFLCYTVLRKLNENTGAFRVLLKAHRKG